MARKRLTPEEIAASLNGQHPQQQAATPRQARKPRKANKTDAGQPGDASGSPPVDLRLAVELASEIDEEETQWLLYPWFPLSQISFIAGNTQVGKSTFLSWLIGKAGRAAVLPGYEENVNSKTIGRLRVNGAKMGDVLFLRKYRYTLPRDQKVITKLLKDHGAKLLTVDPIDSYMDGDLNDWDKDDIRTFLESFKEMAEEARCAAVAVRHIGKDTKNVTPGSRSWRDVPRQITLLFKDGHFPPRYFVKLHKDAEGTHEGVREYCLDFSKGKIPKFKMMGETDSSVEELASVEGGQTGRRQVTEAAKLIRHMFEECSEPLAADLKNECVKNGISDRARNEAKTMLGIDQKPGGKGGSWIMFRTTKEWPSWVPEVSKG